jgi:hypothetical protein
VTWDGSEIRCSHCPVAAGLRCKGREVRRLCELVDPTNTAYNPAYLSLLEQGEADELAPGGPEGANNRLTLSESLALIHLMNQCPDRFAQTDCDCAGLARCARNRGRTGLVNHLDCFNCLRADPTWGLARPDSLRVNME